MPTNWPPTNAPAWPPPEISTTWLSFSDRTTMQNILGGLYGYTWRNPTNTESQLYFKNTRCDEGHPVSGVMIVSPTGVAYPFAYCTSASHRALLVLWPPYDNGAGSDF